PALRRYDPLQPCDDDRLCSWRIDDSAWTLSTTAIHLSPIPCNARAPSARFTPKTVERRLRFTYITNLVRRASYVRFAVVTVRTGSAGGTTHASRRVTYGTRSGDSRRGCIRGR